MTVSGPSDTNPCGLYFPSIVKKKMIHKYQDIKKVLEIIASHELHDEYIKVQDPKNPARPYELGVHDGATRLARSLLEQYFPKQS